MVTGAPLVSIVITCFNYGRFLAEAIESALAQTYQPIEVVVVDDGSTDDSAAVAHRYPVTLVQQPNQGLSAASNAGIRGSRGEFVMRLDADDRLLPAYVEKTARLLIEQPDVHFVYTQVRYFGARSGTYPVEDFDPGSLTERNYVHASALMRRASFEAIGGYSRDMRGLRCEDWDLWLSFAERGWRGRLVHQQLLEYRQHAGGSMVQIELRTLAGLRREIAIAHCLRRHHPRLFAPGALLARLARLPARLRRREVSARFAVMLVGFYGVVLADWLSMLTARRSAVATISQPRL
jgi:glycosyltransferase involved in cell wall biosynthesis